MRAVPVLLLCLAACGGGDPGLDDGWEMSTPAAEGIDPAGLEAARTYAFGEGKYTQGVVVVRHGKIVAEWYGPNASVASYGTSWSVAKSVASILVGIAHDEGLIPDLDVPIADHVPAWRGTDHEAITLRHVLMMSSGLDWDESYAIGEFGESDVIAMVVTEGSHLEVVEGQPIAHPPGEVFNYSSGDAMLLSAVLASATGMPAGEYAQQRLFGPLGISGAEWWRDVAGDTLTYCCLDMRTRDFARLGQLYLAGGEDVVPASWVEASIAPTPAYEGYGYMWWLIGAVDPSIPADTYAALGHDGQYVYVIPSLDLVVARNGDYVKAEGDPVASPNLFDRIPPDGLVNDAGTRPPDAWDDGAFLGPIVDAIDP